MYEDLSLSQLHRFLAVAQSRLHGKYSDEVKQIAKTVIEELQQAIADKAKENKWRIGDKKISKTS